MKKNLLKFLVVILSITALFAILGLMDIVVIHEMFSRVFMFLALFALLGFTFAINYNNEKLKIFSIIGIVLTVICFFALSYAEFKEIDLLSYSYNFILSLITATGTLSIISLLLKNQSENKIVSIVKSITIVLIVLTAIISIYCFFNPIDYDSISSLDMYDTLYRIIEGLSILSILGFLLVPILNVIYRNDNK